MRLFVGLLALTILAAMPGCEDRGVAETPTAFPPATPALTAGPVAPPAATPSPGPRPSPDVATPPPVEGTPTATPPAVAVRPGPIQDGYPPEYVTIDQGYYEGRQYRAFPVTRPQLYFVEDQRDLAVLVLRGAASLGPDLYRVSEKAFEEISRVDFQRYFVVVAFSSSAMRPDGDLRIDEVWTVEDRAVYFRALIYEPRETLRLAPSRTAYHALLMGRDQFSPGKTYEFVLLNQDGLEIARARLSPNERGEQKPVPVPFEDLGLGGAALNTPSRGLFRIVDGREVAAALVDEMTSDRRPPPATLSPFLGLAPVPHPVPPSLRAMLETNFDEGFAVVIFSTATVIKVNQVGAVVELRTVFRTLTPGQVDTQPPRPWQVIRMSKSKLIQKGELTFVLFDHLGFERARATAVVN
ncbi:MAG: hypothetical protein HY673_21210 [Chloroflexi bacterium]|nr:hypothetical protein [Chloroflexota bacterium]